MNIVLVHGAWADASSWRRVIPFLLRAGHRVVAPQLRLTTLADDVATTRRALEELDGPTVLVGHSYGGAVISGAGYRVDNVAALVYLAAFAPDEGETLGDIVARFRRLDSADDLIADAAGFLFIDRDRFAQDFAQDLDPLDARILAAVQKPIAATILAVTALVIAWPLVRSFLPMPAIEEKPGS
jgi:pimeloyl-ACP methyl ester carboxylesterase